MSEWDTKGSNEAMMDGQFLVTVIRNVREGLIRNFDVWEHGGEAHVPSNILI